MKKTVSLIAVFVMSLILVPALTASVAVAGIDEGIEYKKVEPAQPTITKDKIEVVELFWYGCPHCYHFEPKLKAWLAKKPDNVVFLRIPAVFNPLWALHAKAYYTAEALDVLDKIHEPLFDAIHKHKMKLDNEAVLQKFFADYGVSADDFKNTFNSFVIDAKVRRAADLTKRYRIDGVPTMIVNGKYRTDGPMANGQDGMLKIVDFLVEKESRAK